MHMQQKVVKCCHQFFVKRFDLDGNEDNGLDEFDGDEHCYYHDMMLKRVKNLSSF